MFDNFILFLKLSFESHSQVLNSCGYFHLFATHHHILVLVLQLHLQRFDHSFGLPRLHQQLTVLLFEAGQLFLHCLRHLHPLVFLVLELAFHSLQLLLILLLHLPERVDQFFNNFKSFLDCVAAFHLKICFLTLSF